MIFSSYTIKTIGEVFKDLNSSWNGLSEKEAGERLLEKGFNEIKEKESGLFNVFWRQFKSPFIYLLFAASLIAFTIKERLTP